MRGDSCDFRVNPSRQVGARETHKRALSASSIGTSGDMHVSTLRDYVQALGGELRMVAKFPDSELQLHMLQEAQLR
jgi:hypothetical protein